MFRTRNNRLVYILSPPGIIMYVFLHHLEDSFLPNTAISYVKRWQPKSPYATKAMNI